LTAQRGPVPATPASFVPLLSYQREDVESPDRFRWCCWSRQSGKSFTKTLRRILRGLTRGRNQILLSAGERQSRELMLKVRQHCWALRIAAEYLEEGCFAGTRFRQLEARLPNGVRVVALPANPATARGFTGDVLLDEFAMHAEDRQIWAAVFPSVLRGGGELDVASTPKGRANMFWRLGNNELFGRSVVTLPQAVAAGLKVDVDQVRRSMDDETLYRQEFLCEFLDENTAFLSYEMIAACEDASLSQEADLAVLSRSAGPLYAGVDVGRRRDLTVMWMVEPSGDVLVTRGVMEMCRATFQQQQEKLSGLLSLPAMRRCCIDAGGLGMHLAETAVAQFGSHRVEAVTLTAALKAQLAGALRLAVEARAIRIPAEERIRNDWHSMARLVTPAGHVRYDAQRSGSGHGDRFWAAALAVHAATLSPWRIERLRTGPLDFARTGIW